MKRIVPLVVFALFAVACSGPESSFGTATPATSVPASGSSTTSASPVTSAATVTTAAADPFSQALAATQAASAYAFDATVSLFPASGELVVELSGWVDGPDRELVVTAGDQTVKTVVLDGVATVVGPDGTTEIPLSEAPTGPSLGLLSQVQVTEEGPGMVRGILPAAAVPDLGQGTAEPTDAEITIFYEDVITGYRLADPGRTWSVEVTFDGVGEPHAPSA